METYISYPRNPTQIRLICSGLHVRVQHEHAISITLARSRLMLLGLDTVFEEEFAPCSLELRLSHGTVFSSHSISA